jgi:hypothetical protein
MTEHVGKLILKVADAIELHGLNHGGLHDYRTGAMCVMGAIRYVVHGSPDGKCAIGPLVDRGCDCYKAIDTIATGIVITPEHACPAKVFTWNDRSSKITVINKLRDIGTTLVEEDT